jgi:hypothetical protein
MRAEIWCSKATARRLVFLANPLVRAALIVFFGTLGCAWNAYFYIQLRAWEDFGYGFNILGLVSGAIFGSPFLVGPVALALTVFKYDRFYGWKFLLPIFILWAAPLLIVETYVALDERQFMAEAMAQDPHMAIGQMYARPRSSRRSSDLIYVKGSGFSATD